MTPATTMTRRSLVRAGALAGAGLLAVSARAPAFVRSRPELPLGVQSGDPTSDGAIVWAKADRPSRMLVEYGPAGKPGATRWAQGPVLTAESDFTGKVALRGLPAGERTGYRVVLEDLRNPGVRSAPAEGSLRTAPIDRRDIAFTWSGDLAGQGWGINPDFGGFRIFDAMAALEPDLFLCSGDTVYADGLIEPSVTLPDGRVWRNVVTPAKQKVAETLDEYRGQFAYNLLDAPLRAFNARVAQVNQWDDHEVHNNWWPGEIISDPRYTERRADVLAARGRRAFFEYLPIAPRAKDAEGRIYRMIPHGAHVDLFVLDMRTYRDPNGDNRYVDPSRGLLGVEQRTWLRHGLARSRATWKVIANDLPIGLGIEGPPGLFEAVAQGDGGPPLGRELEIAGILRDAQRDGVRNLVFLTADVHNAYAHRYDPSRASVGDFAPFWEFVAGPLNAGAFPPSGVQFDATFGQEVVFAAQPPRPNTSPLEGYQFFGHVAVEGASGVMTVSLRDLDGRVVFAQELTPEPAGG